MELSELDALAAQAASPGKNKLGGSEQVRGLDADNVMLRKNNERLRNQVNMNSSLMPRFVAEKNYQTL